MNVNLICGICGTEKDCLGGCSAHPNNWYCPNCDTPKVEMTPIERTKHDGAVRALKERLDSFMFELTNRNWEAIKSNGHYNRMGKALTDANTILCQMRETLDAIQELEPKNR